jgi:hypothetical protein
VNLVLRGLAGVLVGVAYGLLVCALAFLATLEDRHTPYPGPLIPNRNEAARLATDVATFVGVACGVVVGLAAGLSGVGKWRAAAVGFVLGLTVQSLVSYYDDPWPALLKGYWPAWRNLLTLFAVLPCGLALTGVAASAVAGLLRPHK